MADKLTKEDILKLAKLSRLKISETEIELFRSELNIILDFVSVLATVEVNDLLPTDQVSGLVNITREDEFIDYGYHAKDLLNNVAEVQDNYIKVPKMFAEK